MRHILSLLLLLLLVQYAWAQESFLRSGPMLAYSTQREVLVWAQTTQAARVQVEYWPVGGKGPGQKTTVVPTQSATDFVAHVRIGGLEPGQHYEYRLWVNDKKIERPGSLQFQTQALWQWRTDAPDFRFVAGSCAYINETAYDRPGNPYGGDYQVFEQIAAKQPDFMVWMGDNTYLREVDWDSRTGIAHRFAHTRATPQMQAMWASMHHYGIWDDHDYGPNDSDRSYPLRGASLEVFRSFFPAPNYVFDQGVTHLFQWSDCDFFMLDNRWWRTPNNRTDLAEHQILGQQQIEWLLDALSNSRATFKFVVMGGQFLSPRFAHERHTRFAPQERQTILQAIKRMKIDGVVFLSGDVHYAELTRWPDEEAYPFYELTTSPLSAGPAGQGAEANYLQVPGTLYKGRNFAQLSVRGKKGERSLHIDLCDSNGQVQWTQTIQANELRFKR